MTGPCLSDSTTVALRFASTPDDGYDAAAAAELLGTWLVEQGLADGDVRVTRTELSRFLKLRDAVRTVLGARIDRTVPADAAVRILEAAALAAPGTPIGVWAPDGTVTRGWRSTGGDPLDRAAATIAADAVDLVCDRGDRLERRDEDGRRFVLSAAT